MCMLGHWDVKDLFNLLANRGAHGEGMLGIQPGSPDPQSSPLPLCHFGRPKRNKIFQNSQENGKENAASHVTSYMHITGFKINRSKTEVQRDAQNSKSENKIRRDWPQHENKCKPQMGQNQVSKGVSVLCWLTATILWKPPGIW